MHQPKYPRQLFSSSWHEDMNDAHRHMPDIIETIKLERQETLKRKIKRLLEESIGRGIDWDIVNGVLYEQNIDLEELT